MGANHLQCPDGQKYWRGWFHHLTTWKPDIPYCPHCNKPMRWFGEWPPPKARPDWQPRPYEVYVAFLEDEPLKSKAWLEFVYLPALILCEEPPESRTYVVWPRYWVKPEKTVRFGQDGPHLSIDDLESMIAKVRRFLSARGKAP